MSFLETARRALSTKADEYFDDRDYEQEYDEYEEEEPRKNLFSFLSRKSEDDYDEDYYEEDNSYKSNSYNRSYSTRTASRERFQSAFSKPQQTTPAPRANLSGIEVTVHYPETFDDATKIIREVKANKITIFDISTITSDDEARRVVDYIGGAAEGMECPFKRLCPSIFCIAPTGVSFDLKKRY